MAPIPRLHSKTPFLVSAYARARPFGRSSSTLTLAAPNSAACTATSGGTTSSTTIYRRFSADNGRSWSEPEEMPHHWQTAEGMVRTWRDGGGALYQSSDPPLLLRVYLHGVLPQDDAVSALARWSLEYAVSADGGRTNLFHAPVLQEGSGFDLDHPMRGVWIGRNSLMHGVEINRSVSSAIGPVAARAVSARDPYSV